MHCRLLLALVLMKKLLASRAVESAIASAR
jgi:hypothetical protein